MNQESGFVCSHRTSYTRAVSILYDTGDGVDIKAIELTGAYQGLDPAVCRSILLSLFLLARVLIPKSAILTCGYWCLLAM